VQRVSKRGGGEFGFLKFSKCEIHDKECNRRNGGHSNLYGIILIKSS